MLTFQFVEGSATKPFETAVEAEMDKALKYFEKELAKIRSGKAHTAMVEDIKVDCYGSLMPLKQLAALSTPESNLIVIQPWDKSIIGDIERALSTSQDLGITPLSDGNIIRLQLPRLSSERREELIKTLGKKLEESKVAIRTTRKDFHNLLREAEKEKKISEDYSKRLQDALQKVADKCSDTANKLSSKKESELRVV